MRFIDIKRQINSLAGEPGASLADYIQAEKAMATIDDVLPPYMRTLKIALLSSFTIRGFPEVMCARGVFHNLFLETYEAPYNQFTQDVVNTKSALFSFDPQCIFFLIDGRDFLGEWHLRQVVDAALCYSRAKIIIADFLEQKNLNDVLREYSGEERIRIFEFKKFLEHLGLKDNWYTKYRELGDFRLAPHAFPALAEELLGYAVATAGNTRKCVVTDLDNTLWKGIVGEDGLEAITPNLSFQNQLLEYHREGVLIAVNSMNTPEEALAVFDRPDMHINKNHLSAMRINWNPKDRNMEELAEELNLGLESFVFVDDDPYQRGLVRNSFPEIAVVHPDMVPAFSGFTRWSITDEDRRRGMMYQEERIRKDFEKKFVNTEDFLRELEIKMTIRNASDDTIPRISQLTQKTNQFNLTTRRYTEDEIRNFMSRGGKIWMAELRDHFGDYGVVGVCMVMPIGAQWRIDNFLLSCRVLGRRVEQTFMAYLAHEAKKSGAAKILAEFIPTQKNKPCETFWADQRFSLVRKEGNTSFYECNLLAEYSFPEFITLIA